MSRHPFGTIGVLMGGYSSEREISLRSGHAVADALSQEGHRVLLLDITTDDPAGIIRQIQETPLDIAFIALHGRLGEDGIIQGILEKLDIPYTGSGVAPSQIAFNKILTQKALQSAGLPVAAHYCITDGRNVDFKTVWAQIKSTPLVVKPACEGSSIGVHIVRHPSEWEQSLKDALSYGPQVIIEEFIQGREFTAGIFDREVLPLVEICPNSNFFSFAAKYQKGETKYICPAQVPEKLTREIKELSLNAVEVLGCEGFSRVDLRVDDNEQPFILEVNTIPGFTGTSLFPKAAREAGYSFVQVCEKLLSLALKSAQPNDEQGAGNLGKEIQR
jgi:D-alanine-D-alanine ligase